MRTRFQFLFAGMLCVCLLAACQPESSNPESETDTGNRESPPPAPPAAIPMVAEAVDIAESVALEVAAPDCQLTAGWDPWEPYHYIAAGDEVQGMDIELMNAIASGANCEINYQQGNWSNLLNQLRNDEIDLMMGATRIPEREAFARFSEPYREDSFILYVLEGEATRVENQSLEQLMANGFRLGVTQGYYYGEEFNALQSNPEFADQIIDASVGEMNFTHLLDGQIDGFLEHPPVATAIKRRRGDTDPIIATENSIGGGPVTFMFSRENVDASVVERFNAALQSLKESGEHQRMINRYME